MKVCVLGAGAMGAMLGGYLKRGGAEVYFVDYYEEHMREVSQNGLRLKMLHEEEWNIHMDGAATSSKGIGVCDLVIILVKGLQTQQIVQSNLGIVGSDTVVATFQNGIGNIDILEKFVPRDRIGFGVLKNGASLVSPGYVKGSLSGNQKFSQLYYAAVEPNDKTVAVLDEMGAVLNSSGFTSEYYADAEALIWDKLYMNAIVNIPLAIQRVPVKPGVSNEYMIPILRQVGEEVCAVATAKGFPMDAEKYWNTNIVPIQNLDSSRPLNYSSAVLDTQRKRPTEVDFLNGAVVREGQKLGIPTPANEFIWRMGKACVDFYDISF